MLPTNAEARKAIPVYSGFVCYFPHGMAAIAELSRIANAQHNPGEPLHWAKDKSQDELDALMRHTLDFAIDPDHRDPDGVHPAVKRAWRAMADLERLHDAGVNIFAVGTGQPSKREYGITTAKIADGAVTGVQKSVDGISAPHRPTMEETIDMEKSFRVEIPPGSADLPWSWDVVFTVLAEDGSRESEQRRGPYNSLMLAEDYARRNPENLPGHIHISLSPK